MSGGLYDKYNTLVYYDNISLQAFTPHAPVFIIVKQMLRGEGGKEWVRLIYDS